MLEYVYLGVIIGALAWPVVEQCFTLVFNVFEYWKAKISLKITKVNCEINKIAEESIPTSGYAIGFQAPIGEEEFNDEDDDIEFE